MLDWSHERKGEEIHFEPVATGTKFTGHDWPSNPERLSHRNDIDTAGFKGEIREGIVHDRRQHLENREDAFQRYAPEALVLIIKDTCQRRSENGVKMAV